MSKRPIDLFADILDLRARADSAFNAHDHLPRVVVVGDQVCGEHYEHEGRYGEKLLGL